MGKKITETLGAISKLIRLPLFLLVVIAFFYHASRISAESHFDLAVIYGLVMLCLVLEERK